MSAEEKHYAICLQDALRAAKEKLRGRVALPTLVIYVGVELAQKLKSEYITSAVRSHVEVRDIIMTNKIPDLAGHVVRVDDSLGANEYVIRMNVSRGCV